MNKTKIAPFLITVFILFQGVFVAAQNGRTPALEEFPTFRKSTLLAILYENEPEYNRVIKSAIESYWTITPYKFIQYSELNEYINNYDFSMLVRNGSERIVKRVNSTDRIKSNHLAIYNGNKGLNLRSYTGADALTQFQFKDIEQTSDYAYILPAVIQSMQHYLNFIDKEEISEDNHEKKVEIFNNELAGTIGEKTLFLLEEQLSDDFKDIEKIQKAYKHNVQIVDKEILAQAIEEQNPNVVFMYLDPRVKDIYILAADGGRILYHASVHERGSITKRDFMNLSRNAGE